MRGGQELEVGGEIVSLNLLQKAVSTAQVLGMNMQGWISARGAEVLRSPQGLVWILPQIQLIPC